MKRKIWKIGTVVLIALSVIFLYLTCFFAAILIQLPPSRGDLAIIFGTSVSIIGLALSLFLARNAIGTILNKETYFFVFLVIMFSVLMHIWGNLILKLNLSMDLIATISVLIAIPASCIIVGYSKKDITDRLKKYGFNKGITIATILILSLIPIIEYPLVYTIRVASSGSIIPSTIFRNTDNTHIVNGMINNSGFFAELLLRENQSVEFKNIIELFNPFNKTVNLQFQIMDLIGNYSYLEYLNIYVILHEKETSIFTINNGLFQLRPAEMFLGINETLSLNVNYATTRYINYDTTLSLSLSVSYDDTLMEKLYFVFKN